MLVPRSSTIYLKWLWWRSVCNMRCIPFSLSSCESTENSWRQQHFKKNKVLNIITSSKAVVAGRGRLWCWSCGTTNPFPFWDLCSGQVTGAVSNSYCNLMGAGAGDLVILSPFHTKSKCWWSCVEHRWVLTPSQPRQLDALWMQVRHHHHL